MLGRICLQMIRHCSYRWPSLRSHSLSPDREGCGASQSCKDGDIKDADSNHAVDNARAQNRCDENSAEDCWETVEHIRGSHNPSSIHFLQKAARDPRKIPKPIPIETATNPTMMELIDPFMTRLKISLPYWSVPNQ